jgi:hypothetical protein
LTGFGSTTGDSTPGCVDGHGACPPEDCGGPGGYAELLGVLADPTYPEHEHMRGWVGDRLRPFDRTVTDQSVRRVVGEVPESVRLLLDLIGDGVKLTSGGRLSRTLLRLRHGILSPTRAAGDDQAAVRRLRSAFDPDSFTTEIIELTIVALTQHGSCTSKDIATQIHPMLGYGWQINGRPITESDVDHSITQQSAVMEGLDLIEVNRRIWSLGPSAHTLLPHTAMLTAICG